MPVRYRRGALAAVLTAAAVAIPVAAFASGPGSPATKSAAHSPATLKTAHSPATLKTKSAAGASRPAVFGKGGTGSHDRIKERGAG
jgi:hypothetical protein